MERKQANHFYQHFDAKERPTIDYFVGLFNRLAFRHDSQLTGFLNPRQCEILMSIVGNELSMTFFGGYPNAEKKRVFLSEHQLTPTISNFEISPLEISYNSKFNQLTHAQILGTLTHLSLSLTTLGDIMTDGRGRWQFFVEKKLAPYLKIQMTKVGRTPIQLDEIAPTKIVVPVETDRQERVISTSLRLDSILSAICHLSRIQVKKAILSGEVMVNFHPIIRTDQLVLLEDVLSLRHFGRFQVCEVAQTQKGRYRLTIRAWRSQKRKK